LAYATNSGFFVGDSVVSYNWFGPITSSLVNLENYATGGKGLVGGTSPTITESWNTNWPNRLASTNFAILQGGVNDIKSFSIQPAAIKAAFQLLLDDAIDDVGAGQVFVQNIAPWGAHSSWNSTLQGYTDDVNEWFAVQSVIQGFTLIDINSAWAGVDPDEMLAAYDSGDGIHPSQAGVDIQEGLYRAAFIANETLNLVSTMNTISASRGAIEPADVSVSGNYHKASRGAVEPAYVIPSVGDGFIVSLVGSLVKPLVSNLVN
jgi:lysophospholipase L1-like esterase